jgi:hypothetical protein
VFISSQLFVKQLWTEQSIIMDAITRQLEIQHFLTPLLLHKARHVVMMSREACTMLADCGLDEKQLTQSVQERQNEYNVKQNSTISPLGPCHIIIKAFNNIVDPYYDEGCDSDDNDEYSSNFSVEDTSCSVSSSSSCNSSSDEEEVDDDEIHNSESIISNNNRRKVSFCTPLVTACYVRPTTTLNEKYELYYTDIEYRAFRRNYILFTRGNNSTNNNQQQQHQPMTPLPASKRRRKNTIVQFHANVVTNIYTVPNNDDYPTTTSDLYYSRMELQGYVLPILFGY